MKPLFWTLPLLLAHVASYSADLRITTLDPSGGLTVTNTFTNGVVTFEHAPGPAGPWTPDKNIFSTGPAARVDLAMTGAVSLVRALAVDLTGDQPPWMFVSTDIVDLPTFVNRLSFPTDTDGVSLYLSMLLSPDTLDLLFSYLGGEDPDLQLALVGDLNGILGDGSIYDAGTFSGVALSPSTLALLAQNPSGQETVRLNRALLEDAYPSELLQKRAAGFVNFVNSFGLLTTLAGSGNINCAACNSWQESFEGGPATNAALSSPHIAMADRAGNLYIADKRSHAIRKVTPEGILVRVAGINISGFGTTDPAPATTTALFNPNGLWVFPDGTFYILDRDNGLIRKVDTNGIMTTPVNNGGAIPGGRGLWVSPDESVILFAAGSDLKRWDRTNGLSVYASGFLNLGNIAIDPAGRVVVTDSDAHRVYRIGSDGTRTVIAGNGSITGGRDGQLATETALVQVRAIWFLPNGGYLLGTDTGCQVWYVDTDGHIHLLLNGSLAGPHVGDGTWFYDEPTTPRVGMVKQVTMDYDNNLILTEGTAGYIRKIQFSRLVP